MSNALILLASGTGSRMGLGYNKMLYKIDGETVLNIVLKKFLKYEQFDQILVTLNPNDVDEVMATLPKDPRIEVVLGGSERQYSVSNALEKVNSDYVFVHDGARIYISDAVISRCLEAVKTDEAAYVCAVQSKDSIRKVKDGIITEVLNREELYSMQTPQIAKTSVLKTVHDLANKDGVLETDEVGLLYRYGQQVCIIEGDYANIKLTTPHDLGGK